MNEEDNRNNNCYGPHSLIKVNCCWLAQAGQCKKIGLSSLYYCVFCFACLHGESLCK